LTALGGKISGAGAGVESEEGEGVEVGVDGVKLLTVGVGKLDKDSVLQAAKAQIDSVKAASEEVVFEIFDIGFGLVLGGIEAAGLGLMEEVVNEVDEFGGGGGDLGDHGWRGKSGRRAESGLFGRRFLSPRRCGATRATQARLSLPDHQKRMKKGRRAGMRLGTGPWGERPGFSSGAYRRTAAAGFHRSCRP
jgi:hypothetical protein